MKTLIKNGRVVDPSQNLDAVMDLIEDGKITALEKKITAKRMMFLMLPDLWHRGQIYIPIYVIPV